jgi:hypothetical protein
LDNRKTLESGWTFDDYTGTTYHFEHISLSQALERAEIRGKVIVLETVNWTLAEPETCHLNKYFALGMASAIALAARMEIEYQEVAEELVGIRPATPEEADLFLRVSAHFESFMPPAISDEQAEALRARRPPE